MAVSLTPPPTPTGRRLPPGLRWLLTDVPFAILTVVALAIGALLASVLANSVTVALGWKPLRLDLMTRGQFGWPWPFWFPTGPFGGPARGAAGAFLANLVLVLAVVAAVRRLLVGHLDRVWLSAFAALVLAMLVVQGARHAAKLPESERRYALARQRLAALCSADGSSDCSAGDWMLWRAELRRSQRAADGPCRAEGRAAAFDVDADGCVDDDDARLLAELTGQPRPEAWGSE